MTTIATVLLPAGYDPREAVKIHWIWPKGDEQKVEENVMAIQIEIADDLPLLSDGKTSEPLGD